MPETRIEKIGDCRMSSYKSLGLIHRFESPHHPGQLPAEISVAFVGIHGPILEIPAN